MRNAAELADKAWKESESYAQVLGSLEGKRIEAKSIRTSIDNLRRHLVEVDESDDWLQSTLEQFESRQQHLREEEESLKEKYVDIKQLIDGNRRQLGLKQSECGKHENDKAQYERQVSRRDKLIKDIAAHNGMRGFEGELDDMQINEFMQRIQKLSKEQTQALERARREAQHELREAQSRLNQLGQRKSALQEVKNAARRQISQNDREATTYQNRLNDIDMDEGSKAVLESKVEETEARLLQAKEKARSSSWDSEIQQANMEIRELEDKSAGLSSELIEGTKKAGDLARLDHVKKELKDRERSLETMSAAHGDRIKKLVNDTWSPSSLDKDFQTALDTTSELKTRSERDRDAVARELEHIEYRLKSARKDLHQRQNERNNCVHKIRDTIEDEPSEYPEKLNERQVQLDLARKDADQYAGMGEYLSKCLEAANSKKVCRTCARPFKTESEFRTFKNKLENLVKKATEDASDDSLEQLEGSLREVKEIGPYYDTWVRLSDTEIPSLEKDESELGIQREALMGRIEEHDKVVSERAESKRNVESLSKTVASITKCENDITTFKSQIEDLTMRQQQSGGSRTLEDIQENISSISEQLRGLQKTVSKLNSEKDQSRTEVTNLEFEVRDTKSRLDNAIFQLEKKAGLQARIEEYSSLNSKQKESIEKADEDIEALSSEFSTAQARYDDMSSRAEDRERDLQKIVSELSDCVHQLDMANEDITAYIERGGENQLARSKQEIQDLERDIGHSEREQGKITKEINGISSRLQDSENTKRQYSDNLRYRQETNALQSVNAEIETLAAQNAEVDRGRFKQESERRTREHNALAARQASKMGEMKSKDDQLMQLLADWNTDYKDAAVKFKEAHIKVETTKAAVDDLGRYGSALDKAIMKYHSLKMEEINRIVEELWQKTYRGTDVDTILIRSDNENAKGNRSYNYRVCMVKQDAEMDMRGRCSAGQKVLASIIIRLALAECFGINCGLIALDEPTTNLDRDNIRSLAESLHDIIRARQQQANFQLIVITHDEEFLRHMQCGDFCDYYYRVSRNERQKSIIERQSIAEVSTLFIIFFFSSCFFKS